MSIPSNAGADAENGIRTFSLNSNEAYVALCPPRERPWIPNGALPREPRSWDPEVVVERSVRRK
jgi:hypothetical protein